MSLLSVIGLQKSMDDFSTMHNITYQSLGFSDKDDLDSWFCDVIEKYNNSISIFEPLETIKINSKRTVHKTSLKNRILIHAVSTRIKILFAMKISSRNSNIGVLRNIFTSNNRISIVKLDVSKFFDNISHSKLLEIMSKNRILDMNDIKLIEFYLKSVPKAVKGVHQGTELSNILSEVFFSSLDKSLKSLDSSLIFSERYVDDILLVFNRNFHDEEVNDFYKNIKSDIESYHLNLNEQKTKILSVYMKSHYNKIEELYSSAQHNVNSDYLKVYSLSKKGNIHKIKKTNIDLTYLGYRFNWIFTINPNIANFFIDISPKKVYKYKTRAYKIFNEFKKYRLGNPNNRRDFAFYLLRERLRFFSTTYVLPAKKNDYTKSIIGINSNYQFIQNVDQIKKLHNYLKSNIFYLFKQTMITELQMKALMLIVMQNKKFIPFVTMDISLLKSWITAMSPTTASFPNNLANHYLRKSLTSMYMKRVKI